MATSSTMGAGGLVSIRLGPMSWRVESGFQARIISPFAPPWNNLGEDSRSQLIKSNPQRRIYLFKGEERELYVKEYFAAKLTDKLKWWYRRCPGQVELERLQYAQQHSVPAPQPVGWAVGEWEGQPKSILLTESLGEMVTLEDMLWGAKPVSREGLMAALGAAGVLLARMHRVGMEHHDLHTGNILLPRSSLTENISNKDVQAYITDLQNVVIRRGGGIMSPRPAKNPWSGAFRRWRLANTAMLLAGIEPLTNRMRPDSSINIAKDVFLRSFVRNYLTTLAGLEKWSSSVPLKGHGTSIPAVAAQPQAMQEMQDRYFGKLADLIDSRQRWYYRKRDRRALRNSRYAQEIKLPGGWLARVYLKSRYPMDFSTASSHSFTTEDWQKVLAEPETLLQEGAILKKGGHNTVLVTPITIGKVPLDVVIKHTRLHRSGRGWLQALRESRARRQWQRANALISRQIPSAWPLAMLERFKGPFLKESIFLCERICAAEDLHHFLESNPLSDNPVIIRELADKLGRILGHLRHCGFKHRDCKATNILIQCEPGLAIMGKKFPSFVETKASTISVRPLLVDLDGLRLRMFNWKYCSHEALVRLAVSVSSNPKVKLYDIVRVYRRYLDYLDMPESRNCFLRKKLWRKLSRQVQKKLSQDSAKKLYNREFTKILIVKPSSLGDVVRCMPILHFLRERYPKARISWLVQNEYADILRAEKELDEIIEFDRKYFGKIAYYPKATWDFCRFLGNLRQKQFDLVLDLQGLFRSGFLSLITGSGVRLGFADSREWATLFYSHKISVPAQKEHVVESYGRTIQPLRAPDQPIKAEGLKIGSGNLHNKKQPEELCFKLTIEPESQSRAREMLQQAGVTEGDKYMVILAGGTEAAKRWDPGRFATLADKVHNCYDMRTILLGAGKCEEAIGEEIAPAVRREKQTRSSEQGSNEALTNKGVIINLVGQTSLQEMTAILKEAALVVGNDSGPLHVAAALSVPLVGLYGPTDPAVVGPYGQLDGVVQASSNIPRKRRYSRLKEHQMVNITVDEVFEAVKRKI